jgi:hypothetical protein
LAWGRPALALFVVAVLVAALDIVLAVVDVSQHPSSAAFINDQPQPGSGTRLRGTLPIPVLEVVV